MKPPLSSEMTQMTIETTKPNTPSAALAKAREARLAPFSDRLSQSLQRYASKTNRMESALRRSGMHEAAAALKALTPILNGAKGAAAALPKGFVPEGATANKYVIGDSVEFTGLGKKRWGAFRKVYDLTFTVGEIDGRSVVLKSTDAAGLPVQIAVMAGDLKHAGTADPVRVVKAKTPKVAAAKLNA